jgi:hypothetical protein
MRRREFMTLVGGVAARGASAAAGHANRRIFAQHVGCRLHAKADIDGPEIPRESSKLIPRVPPPHTRPRGESSMIAHIGAHLASEHPIGPA